MAGVDGINLGTVSVKSLSVAKGNSSLATDSTRSFEQFLDGRHSAQKKQVETDLEKNVTTSQEASLDQTVHYAKRDELTTEKPEEAVYTENADVADDVPKAEEMMAIQQEIRDIIKETLSIEDDMIDTALKMLGITLTDLFNPDILQQFVLVVNGGQENTDFLTDEDLLQGFVDLTQVLEDFSKEQGNSLVAMMEQLDTPVEFDDFLQQQEIMQIQPEKKEQADISGSVANGVAMVETKESQLQQPIMKNEPDTEGLQSVSSEIPEKVVISQSKEQGTEAEAGRQESVDAFKQEKSQDFSMTEGFEEDGSELLYSQQEDLSESSQEITPLFSDKGNVFQEDLSKVWKPEMNGVQKMQQMVDIVNQVSEQIRRSVSTDTTTLEMQLNPERLGKVYFSVVSKAGVMTATFQVQTEEARHALESQMLTLRENLEAKNLKVESVEVQVSDFSFTQSSETESQNQSEFAKQGKRKFRYDTEEAEDLEGVEETDTETVRRQMMQNSGGSIDFTA